MPSYTGVLTSGTTLIVAAPTTGFIRVLGYQTTSKASDITLTLQSATNAKATVLLPATEVGGICCPPTVKEPYFDCNVGEALNATLSAPGNVALNVQYALMG